MTEAISTEQLQELNQNVQIIRLYFWDKVSSESDRFTTYLAYNNRNFWDRSWEKSYWTEWYKAMAEVNVKLISSWMQSSLLILTSNIWNSLSFLIVYMYIFSTSVAPRVSMITFSLITLKSWECKKSSWALFNYNNYQVIQKCKYLCSGSSPSWSGRWLAGRNRVWVLPKSALIYITQIHHSSLSENNDLMR